MAELKKLPIARYRLTLTLEQPLRLPEYPGSMLRGSLGHGLRGISCVTRQATCKGCPLLASCQYPRLFEPQPPVALKSRFATIPAPFVLEVQSSRKRFLEAGETLTFGINLFGYAVDHLSTLILAWQRAAWSGFGKQRARAILTLVEWQHPDGEYLEVFTKQEPLIVPHEARLPQPFSTPANSLTLDLLTPTRIQRHGKFCNSQTLTLRDLQQALLRKVELYAYSYWGGLLPEIPTEEGLEMELDATVRKWTRYSSRQRQTMNLDGLVGRIRLSGDLSQWTPWLQLGQYTHVGKNTAFGLGQYRILERAIG